MSFYIKILFEFIRFFIIHRFAAKKILEDEYYAVRYEKSGSWKYKEKLWNMFFMLDMYDLIFLLSVAQQKKNKFLL